MKTVFISDQHAIKVEQYASRGKRFRVTYFKQIKDKLDYTQAAHELGECLFHALACEGILDNEGV